AVAGKCMVCSDRWEWREMVKEFLARSAEALDLVDRDLGEPKHDPNSLSGWGKSFVWTRCVVSGLSGSVSGVAAPLHGRRITHRSKVALRNPCSSFDSRGRAAAPALRDR